jgi:hypothetical protein
MEARPARQHCKLPAQLLGSLSHGGQANASDHILWQPVAVIIDFDN